MRFSFYQVIKFRIIHLRPDAKAKDFLTSKVNLQSDLAGEEGYLFLKVNYKLEKIYFKDILYIQALQNYIAIHLAGKKLVT